MKRIPGRKKSKMVSIAKKDALGRRIIEVGEIVPLMAKKMEKGLARCMQDNMHRRRPYWILYTADWYKNGTELKDTFSPRDKIPPRMLNSICWYIDNTKGRLEQVWVLPKDAPIEDFGETGTFDEVLIRSSKGLPIIYGGEGEN